MKVLLDECVTRKLRNDFSGHEVHTVEQAGFKGLKNGQLLKAASETYDVLITVDQNIHHQQNLKLSSLAILILAAKRNTYESLRPLMPEVLEALTRISPGELVIINEKGLI